MRRNIFLIGLLGGLLVGCVFLRPFGIPLSSEKSTFNHKVHVEKEEMACEDCHGNFKKTGEPKKPKLSGCEDCHDGEEKNAQKFKDFVASKKVAGKVKWLALPATYGDVKFSHKSHLLDYKFKCEDCHGDIAKSKTIQSSHINTMDDCMDCHTKQKKGPVENCAGCHRETRKERKPKSHGRLWEKLHGDLSKQDNQKCLFCHSERTCVSCHQTEPPKDHNTQWLHGGHGYMAEVDRDRCAACHTSDSCVRCHNTTEPTSHKGGWGRTQNLHCLSCHEPTTPNCSVCHGPTMGHQAWATKKPNDTTHNNATECRSCHGDLKHPDNGQDCRICH